MTDPFRTWDKTFAGLMWVETILTSIKRRGRNKDS